MHYYNEYDKHAASWLRELLADGLIPAGHVDERSITDIQPSDLEGYVQCHFFAGIGGWPLALQLAGWPDNRPVWTGSCPCQPYSNAGKGLGDADPRNLWPVFFNLIRRCRPQHVFGEQVESAIRHGWLDGVSTDLEGEGYACGAVVLGAHSVGAPHIRQRLYWVADSLHGRSQNGRAGGNGQDRGSDSQGGANTYNLPTPEKLRATCGMANRVEQGLEGHSGNGDDGSEPRRERADEAGSVAACCNAGGRADGIREGFQGGERDRETGAEGKPVRHPGECCRDGSWSDSVWHPCRDGKYRRIPVESSIFPLAHGISGRVGLLRGAGNAIVPQAAASFIQAVMDGQP